jgi:hypothetical protein
VIRIRGLPVSNEDAAELALRLRAQSDAGTDLAARLERTRFAGVVFREESTALEQRLLGVQDPGTNSPETASVSQDA